MEGETSERSRQVRLQPKVAIALDEVRDRLQDEVMLGRVSNASAAGYAILWCRKMLREAARKDLPTLSVLME